MITFTDVPNAKQPHWDVKDTTGKIGNHILTYNSSCIYGYDRLYVLRQAADLFSLMAGCKNKGWQTQGSVFVLS